MADQLTNVVQQNSESVSGTDLNAHRSLALNVKIQTPRASNAQRTPWPAGTTHQQAVSAETVKGKTGETMKDRREDGCSNACGRAPAATYGQQLPTQQRSTGPSYEFGDEKAQPPMLPHSNTEPTAQVQ